MVGNHKSLALGQVKESSSNKTVRFEVTTLPQLFNTVWKWEKFAFFYWPFSIGLRETTCRLLLVQCLTFILWDSLQEWKLARLFHTWLLLGSIIFCQTWSIPSLSWFPTWSAWDRQQGSPAMQEIGIWFTLHTFDFWHIWEGQNLLFWYHLKIFSVR